MAVFAKGMHECFQPFVFEKTSTRGGVGESQELTTNNTAAIKRKGNIDLTIDLKKDIEEGV
jgi:hypothetical protein